MRSMSMSTRRWGRSGAGSRSATVGQLSKLRAFQSEERALYTVGVSLEANWRRNARIAFSPQLRRTSGRVLMAQSLHHRQRRQRRLAVDAGNQFAETISAKQIERGVIKLGGMQSCIFDSAHLPLPGTFSGGLSLAVAPTTKPHPDEG